MIEHFLRSNSTFPRALTALGIGSIQFLTFPMALFVFQQETSLSVTEFKDQISWSTSGMANLVKPVFLFMSLFFTYVSGLLFILVSRRIRDSIGHNLESELLVSVIQINNDFLFQAYYDAKSSADLFGGLSLALPFNIVVAAILAFAAEWFWQGAVILLCSFIVSIVMRPQANRPFLLLKRTVDALVTVETKC